MNTSATRFEVTMKILRNYELREYFHNLLSSKYFLNIILFYLNFGSSGTHSPSCLSIFLTLYTLSHSSQFLSFPPSFFFSDSNRSDSTDPTSDTYFNLGRNIFNSIFLDTNVIFYLVTKFSPLMTEYSIGDHHHHQRVVVSLSTWGCVHGHTAD